MDIGLRMQKRRKELGLSADEVGDKLGVSRASIYRYESGEIEKFPLSSLNPLAEVLNTTPEYLMGWKDDILSIYNKLEEPRKIKVYNFAEEQLNIQNKVTSIDNVICDSEPTSIIYGRKSAAGYAIEVDDNDAEVRPESIVPKGANERVEITGDSMEPLIKKGSDVYIRHQPTIENGEVAIVRIENEGVTCKRVYTDLENRTVTLKSENKKYEDMHFDPSQITILGKVLL